MYKNVIFDSLLRYEGRSIIGMGMKEKIFLSKKNSKNAHQLPPSGIHCWSVAMGEMLIRCYGRLLYLRAYYNYAQTILNSLFNVVFFCCHFCHYFLRLTKWTYVIEWTYGHWDVSKSKSLTRVSTGKTETLRKRLRHPNETKGDVEKCQYEIIGH